MGGTSWMLRDPLVRLRVAAASCFFGEPQYYHHDAKDTRPKRYTPRFALSTSQINHLRLTLGALDPQGWRAQPPAERMESAIDAALAHNVERTLKEAVRLRGEAHIRTTPLVILVRAANHEKARGTGLVRRYARDIVRRGDEPSVAMAYQIWRFGKPVPNSLKRSLRDALQSFDDYALAKYRMASRKVKTVDVVNLVHAYSPSIDALAKSTLNMAGRSWEAILSEHGKGKAQVSKAYAWRSAIPRMGHMALLRNLRNFVECNVPIKKYVPRLVETAAKGKQLPFRYYSAYRAIEKCAPLAVTAAVEQCLQTSMDRLPYFRGRVMSLCDNSGSARGTTTSSMGTMQIAAIANL